MLPSKLTVAILPAPDTFAIATLLATAANPTSPVTLAPTTLEMLPPSPANTPAVTVMSPVFAVKPTDTIVLLTSSSDKVPTDPIFGCAEFKLLVQVLRY